MTYLRAFGPKGHHIAGLTWALLILSIVVVVVVSVLVLLGVLVRRARAPLSVAEEPLAASRGGMAWIYIGVGISTLALIGAVVWTGITMAAIHKPPSDPKLVVEVTGHQWWWQVRYLDEENPSRILETANEIHIPVGEPVTFKVRTTDVIHSFWVPALGDKIDLIPNQTNVTWLEASQPGTYRGQCAEYCGVQHAHMALVVVAQKPAEFEAWLGDQLQPAAAPAEDRLTQGERHFIVRWGGCLTVGGTRAGGRLGPDLTHLLSRGELAAATLPNTIAYLSGWIANPQTIKPGNLMPTLDLSGPELASIRGYLETLK
jgi:cytochrome c oxidase subunit 2